MRTKKIGWIMLSLIAVIMGIKQLMKEFTIAGILLLLGAAVLLLVTYSINKQGSN